MEPQSLNQLAFVFWDEHYDELLAVTYITHLRQAGIATKVVSLHGRQALGKNGLLLTAEYTLGEALPLAEHAICVVVPCHSPLVGHLDTDPRARIFLERAAANDAQFVVGRVDAQDLEIFPVAAHLVNIVIDQTAAFANAQHLSQTSLTT